MEDIARQEAASPRIHEDSSDAAWQGKAFNLAETRMGPEVTLVVVNLAAGFGCAIPVARLLGRVNGKPGRVFRYFAILVGVYFVESVALAMGMGIPVFSVGLAFVWGILIGLWLRRAATPVREVLKTAFYLSLYTSLPALSFLVVPLLMSIAGWSILSAQAGHQLGIPDFLPWPLGTILGFYATLAIGAVVFKTVITTGEVSLLIHLGEKAAVLRRKRDRPESDPTAAGAG